MRLLPLFKKTIIENLRDWKILILTLTMAPFFVVLMHFYFGNTSKTFQIKMIIVNHDQGVITAKGNPLNAGEALISEIKHAKYPGGAKILKVNQEKEITKARERLKNKSVDLIVEIPVDFSKILMDYRNGNRPPPVIVKIYGDPTNTKYIMAAAFCNTITFQYNMALTGQRGPLELQAETITKIKSLNDFDLYVPFLLTLALISLMFTAAATLIKEKDKGTIIRLQLSKMTISEFLAAVSLTQIIIGLLALGLTYLTAIGLGYKAIGSLFAAIVIGILSSLAIMAISLLVAALLRTIFDLMTIGCFPFFILMFFSGGMFPLPPLQLFVIGGRSININDILPTTHTITALNKILNFGEGLGKVTFEMGAIVFLTTVYFAVGLWLFKRRHLQPK